MKKLNLKKQATFSDIFLTGTVILLLLMVVFAWLFTHGSWNFMP